MKKLLAYVFAIVFTMAFFVLPQNAYAEDVNFKLSVKNHAAEIRTEVPIDNEEIAIAEGIPEVTLIYKNAVKAIVKLIDPDDIEVKVWERDLDLSSEEKTDTIDFSDVELKLGEYKIIATGYNVDNEETEKREIHFFVREFVDVPSTGDSTNEDGLARNEIIIVTTVMTLLVALGTAYKVMKGARK